MLRLLFILLLGLMCESAGVVLLKRGMSRVPPASAMTVSEGWRIVKSGLTNGQILLGVFFEALFFISLLVLLSGSELSLLWPLTSLSFVFATFAAIWFLNEKVSGLRWAGVVFIMIGAALISYSEHTKPVSAPPPQQTE